MIYLIHSYTHLLHWWNPLEKNGDLVKKKKKCQKKIKQRPMAVLGMMEINTYMGGVTLRSSSGTCLRVGRRIDGGGCTAR